MNDQASALEEQVDEVIAAFLEAERAGETPQPDELLARHPHLADELRSFFADRRCFNRLAGPPAYADNSETTTQDRPAPSLSRIDAGRYVGLEPHARGGLGEVFTATDTELHRVVAVKRLLDNHADNTRSKRHFLLEAEVTARLDHPGVVPVHSLFRDERDRPCYAMRFIEGQTLDDALCAYHAGPPDPVGFRRLLRSFIQVCETIAYAHSRGVLHRDIKPKNIMLGKFGETVVVDWGLAKVIGRAGPEPCAQERSEHAEATLRPVGESDGEHTEMGAAVGTPAYMSPEQAAGRWDVVGAASDVYNLGAVLYTVLTGKPPLEKGNWPELQQRIQRGDFPQPCAVQPAVPRALEAVCLKAMALAPEERYGSARALAAEVELWLADEAVQAYREPATERLWRWARRRRKLLIAYGISGIIALVTLTVGAWIITLETAKTDAARGRSWGEYMQNATQLGKLSSRHAQLHQSARKAVDRMAVQLGQDPGLNRPEFRSLRTDLLENALDFWDEVKAIDNSSRGPIDDRPGKTAYDLARVCALSVMATTDDRGLAERYANRAMEFLREAVAVGYFKEAAAAERLNNDPDLEPLRRREDFRELCREVAAKPN